MCSSPNSEKGEEYLVNKFCADSENEMEIAQIRRNGSRL
jgi:hypothetical protein